LKCFIATVVLFPLVRKMTSAAIRRPQIISRFTPKITSNFKPTLIGAKSENRLLLNKRQFSTDQTQTSSSSSNQASQSSSQPQSSDSSSNVEIETPQTRTIDQSQYGNRNKRSHKHRRGGNLLMPFGSSLFPSFFDTPTTRLFDRLTKEMMSPFMRFPFDWVNDINRQLTSEGLPSSINVDIIEHNDKYIIKASLPGINKENVKVNIERDNDNNQYLTIKAEKKHDIQNEDKDKKYLYSESTYGLIERKVILPDDIDLEKGIDAKLENGELKMEIQKNEEKKKQSHEVKIQ